MGSRPPVAGTPDSLQPGAFTNVSATARYELAAQGGADADTIARIGHEPWIVAGPRYVILGSALDPAATSLPIRAAFVPWLASMLTERLVGEPGGVLQATPGQQLARPRWADAIEDEAGQRNTLADEFPAPQRAGTYFLERAGRRVGAVAVNPEPGESVLDRFSAGDLASRIHARQVLVAADRAGLASLSFRSAARRSIGIPLLVIALGLLAIEGLLVRSGRRLDAAAA